MAPRRAVTPACVLVAASLAGGIAAPAEARKSQVRPVRELVVLLKAHKVMSSPHARRARRGSVSASRPITGGQTVLPVIRRHTSRDGTRWLRVMLPGRPNGKRGWISRRGTRLTRTRWHVVVKTSSRRVLAYRRGRLLRTFAAIVGTPSTPTPHGRFFVEESMRLYPGSPGTPFALALSARSNTLQEYAGGPGQIAIHGVGNIGGTLGTAASHGCVRLGGRSTRWLAARIGPGVPVTISP